jgi:hypothetical protein
VTEMPDPEPRDYGSRVEDYFPSLRPGEDICGTCDGRGCPSCMPPVDDGYREELET